MILTVTLNPAIDKTYTVGQLITGHVNRMKNMVNLPGGKGVNVSRILSQYACPVTATGFLGGYTGRWLEERIREMGILTDFVEVEGDTRCSMNVVADNGYVTEILEPGPEISSEERLLFLGKYRELARKSEIVVISGSMAPGLPDDMYAELITVAKEYGKKVILDSSKEALVLGVAAGPWLVKPNRRELEYVVGHKCTRREDVLEAVRKLQKSGTEYVAVSDGDKGMYLFGEGKGLFAKAPRVKTVNTVGCGDSACASFAMSILKGQDMEEMLRRATAISAANATTMESGSVPQGLAAELEKEIQIKNIL